MIKAEVITHEGIPAPNWLDHCRTMISPAKITALLLAVAALIGVLVFMHHGGTVKVGTSQQANKAPIANLRVAPVQEQTTSDSTNVDTLQAAAASAPTTGSAPVTDTPSDNSGTGAATAAPVGPASTTSSQTYQKSATSFDQFSGKHLTDTVQSTVKSLNDATKKLTNPLGL